MKKIPQLISLLIVLYFPLVTHASDSNCPRIISQSPYITGMLNYLGMGQCIVGVSRYSKLTLPHTGGILDPDAEVIDSVMPDFFITSDWTSPETIKNVIPDYTKPIRLKSFNTMAQLENNMNDIIKATGWHQSADKIKYFSAAWRDKVKQVKGNSKKVLLLSSCGGTPYSFGPNSRLYDLFTQAGFKVVETGEKIRHIKPGQDIGHITALLDRYQPDFLFTFEQGLNKQCQLLTPKVPVRIITFNGKDFLHPTVAILNGLDALISKKHSWQ